MKYAIRVPEGVKDEDRYIKAAQQRIAFNASKGNRKRWLAAHADGERLLEFLFGYGEFESRDDIRAGIFAGDFGDTILSLRNQLDDRGSLSDKQTEILRKCLAQRIKWAAERAEKKADEAAASDHVGTVGERREFVVRVVFVTSFDGQYGTTHVHGLKDDFGNIIIHKGQPILADIEVDTQPRRIEKGDKIRVTATIKSHSVREGVKQTIITRPSRADLEGG